LPVWLVMVVVSRDLFLVLGSVVLYFTGHDFVARPSFIGKTTTLFQLLVVAFSLVLKIYGITSELLPVLYWIAAGLTVASGIQYVARGTKIVS
jgi:phosphatidylglycerophosphate synthase